MNHSGSVLRPGEGEPKWRARHWNFMEEKKAHDYHMAMYAHAVHVTKLIQTISTFFSRRWTKTRPTVGQKLSKEAGRSRASAPSRQVCIPTCPGRPKSHQFESNSARPWVSSMSSTRTGWYAICPKTSTECR